MSVNYGWEKFHGAMHSLVSELPLKNRLLYAIGYNLIKIHPDEDLPKHMRDDFKSLISFATSVKAIGEEGTIEATLNSLSSEELSNIAVKILSMHDSVCKAYGKSKDN